MSTVGRERPSPRTQAEGVKRKLGYPPVLPDVVEEHFEELDFLWEQREDVVCAPDWTLEDLAELEERAEAHLDALRLAELNAVDRARSLLVEGETFAVAAATMVLLQNEAHDREPMMEVVRALAAAESETLEGLRVGLRHSPITAIGDELLTVAEGAAPVVRACAIDVLAFHRASCPDPALVLRGCEDPSAAALLWGAVGRLGVAVDEALLLEALERDDSTLQRAALRGYARVDPARAREICRERMHTSAECVRLLGVVGQDSDLGALTESLDDPMRAEAALAALGALGAPAAVPILLERMEDDELGPLACASFQRITGAEDLELARPLEPPNDAEGEEVDEEAALVVEEPRPDVERARAFWEFAAEDFRVAARWQAGFEIDGEMDRARFDALPLQVRADLACLGDSRPGPWIHVDVERKAILQ